MNAPVDAALAAELDMRARAMLVADGDDAEDSEREALALLAQTATALIEAGVMKPPPVSAPCTYQHGGIYLVRDRPVVHVLLVCLAVFGFYLGSIGLLAAVSVGVFSPLWPTLLVLCGFGAMKGFKWKWHKDVVALDLADLSERRLVTARLIELVSEAIKDHESVERTAGERLAEARQLSPENVLPRVLKTPDVSLSTAPESVLVDS